MNAIGEWIKEKAARLLASLRTAEAEERAGAALALQAHEDARAVSAAPAEIYREREQGLRWAQQRPLDCVWPQALAVAPLTQGCDQLALIFRSGACVLCGVCLSVRVRSVCVSV